MARLLSFSATAAVTGRSNTFNNKGGKRSSLLSSARLLVVLLLVALSLSGGGSGGSYAVNAEVIIPFVDPPKKTPKTRSSGNNNNKVFYPAHPRVNINWTLGSLNTNITKEELRQIEKKKLVLTKLVVINRHGHRAPNAPYWRMCPNDIKNRKKYLNYYQTDPEDLSGLGMQEELRLGQYLRETYNDFLGADRRFNKSYHYFRAVGEPRILQSAMAVAEGIFPQGFGQDHFLPSRPQFVPIFSDMDTHEYLLDDVPCFSRAESDVARWQEEEWPKYLARPEVQRVLREMEEVCGVRLMDEKPGAHDNNDNNNNNSVKEMGVVGTEEERAAPTPPGVKELHVKTYAFAKTVADGMTFNRDLGLPICQKYVNEKKKKKATNSSKSNKSKKKKSNKKGKNGENTSDQFVSEANNNSNNSSISENGKIKLDDDFFYRVRGFSYELLMHRLYSTDEQQTYTVVDLPLTILKLFNHTHLAATDAEIRDYRDTRQESSFFFVHRESLYALAQFFGFKYHVPGLPHGELPVASTLIMEKLMPKASPYEHETDDDSQHIYIRLKLWTPARPTEPLAVAVPACRIPELCELRELRQMYEARVARTGTWEKLCHYQPQELDHTTDIR